MHSVFNSLGSNYDQHFISKSRQLLFSPWTWRSFKSAQELESLLKKQFVADTVYLTYKGRHAITLALQHLGIKQGDQVITQAFTCWAVEEGIRNSGAKPVFADTDSHSLNLSISTLIAAHKKAPEAKAVLIQHTLGFPAPIKAIKAFCQKNHLFLIEDLAHAYGTNDLGGVPLGTYADAVILSFGRDKIIDAISGGALTLKHQPASEPIIGNTPTSRIIIDLLYPPTTSLIRRTHQAFIGKLIHRLLKKTPILTNPIQSTTFGITSLPAPHAQLALDAIANLQSQLEHRRQITKVYLEQLEISTFSTSTQAAPLRLPLLVPQRAALISHLKTYHFHIPDTWYKKPVETGSLTHTLSLYPKDSCPNAEKLSARIINLPTHINVSPAQAGKLALLVNQYVAKHQTNHR